MTLKKKMIENVKIIEVAEWEKTKSDEYFKNVLI